MYWVRVRGYRFFVIPAKAGIQPWIPDRPSAVRDDMLTTYLVQNYRLGADSSKLFMNNLKKENSLQWFWVLLFVGLAAVSAGFLSWRFTRFVPGIHDESSYLFQAQTFLLGRLVNPVHPEHLFFDQYHIINEGVYASKYFPGFALTLVPFVWFGIPYFNPIFFYALELLLIFVIGKELYGNRTAWYGMLLAALSPQIFLQNYFLLSHIPNAVFLLLFLLGFIRSESSSKPGNAAVWILVAAFSWGLSFLIRPVTAIGFAFPVGCLLLYRLLRRESSQPVKKIILWMIPVLLSLAAYFAYNKAVTGDYLKSPFDFYAQIHAPFHRYGFHTWEKYAGEAAGPRVDKMFNEAYHDHTPLIGLKFVGIRLAIFVDYLFGSTILGTILLGIWFFGLRKKNPADMLIFYIWMALQAVHLPHWYPGILTFGSNYLYEASGLVILAVVNTVLILLQHPRLVKIQKILWPALLVTCLLTSCLFTKEISLEAQGLRKLKFWIYSQVNERRLERVVIFLKLPPLHPMNWDITENVPTLNSRIVFAHDRGEENSKLKSYFPGYAFLVWDVETGSLTPI